MLRYQWHIEHWQRQLEVLLQYFDLPYNQHMIYMNPVHYIIRHFYFF